MSVAQYQATIRAERERDEARAIARRLAFELSEHIHPDDMSCVDHLLAAFDALPWAKDEA